MSNLNANVSLIVRVESGQNNHYCRVSGGFPGMYQNDEILSDIEIITTPDSDGNYPVNIQYLTNTNKTSESGSTVVEEDFLLNNLPWGEVPENYITISVNLTDEDEQSIDISNEHGGVISQSEPAGESKPIRLARHKV